MRLIALALIVSLFAVTETGGSEPLTTVEAIEQIGKPSVLVEMHVKKSKDRLEKRGIIYLDSEDDYTDPKNLGVAISAEAAAEFKAAGIGDPAAHFLDKTILVRGCVMRFEDRPYLPVHDPEQISITEETRSAQPTESTTPLIISAAASTTDAMEQLTKQFLDENGIEVKVNAGPSNGLATQIIEGAPADLFLSASREWADKVAESGKAVTNVELLTNRLAVIVPKGNPAQIKHPEDLTNPKLKSLALAGEGVPAGRYADQALTKLGILKQLTDEKRIARGQDVRATLNYVEQGEAEAGIVYVTDAAISPDVEVAFEFDPTLHDEIVYVLVLLKHADDNPDARKFYDFLQSDDAEQVFTKFGFMLLPVAAAP